MLALIAFRSLLHMPFAVPFNFAYRARSERDVPVLTSSQDHGKRIFAIRYDEALKGDGANALYSKDAFSASSKSEATSAASTLRLQSSAFANASNGSAPYQAILPSKMAIPVKGASSTTTSQPALESASTTPACNAIDFSPFGFLRTIRTATPRAMAPAMSGVSDSTSVGLAYGADTMTCLLARERSNENSDCLETQPRSKRGPCWPAPTTCPLGRVRDPPPDRGVP